MDAEAAANPAASSSMSGVIGRSASYPNLQVMSPTGDSPLASNEAMAQHGENQFENENLQRRKGRASRSPRRSADSSVQEGEVSVTRTTTTTMRQSLPKGRALQVQKERTAMSVPARVSPSKAELEAAMQKLSNDAKIALKAKDEQAKAALVAQRDPSKRLLKTSLAKPKMLPLSKLPKRQSKRGIAPVEFSARR